MKQLHQKARPIIRLSVLIWLAISIKSIFVDIFIWRHTQNFQSVVLYNLASYTILFLIFPLTGFWLKHYSARTLVKLGNLLSIIFFIFVIYFQDQAVKFLLPLGLLNGLSAAFFWSGFNLHQYLATHQQDRDYFFGLQEFWSNLASIAGPILAGLVIFSGNNLFLNRPLLGYYLLFALTAFIFLLATREAWFFPRFSQVDFKLSQLYQVIKRNPNFKFILIQQGLWGFRDVSLTTLLSVLAFLVLKQELAVGVYRSLASLILGLSAFIAGQMLNPRSRLKLCLLGATALSLGTIFLAFSQTLFGLVIFALTAFPGSFLFITIGTLYFDIADRDPTPWRQKYAYLVARDLTLGLGRIFSYLILWFLFASFSQTAVVKWWLIFVAFIPPLIWFFIRTIKSEKITDTPTAKLEADIHVP